MGPSTKSKKQSEPENSAHWSGTEIDSEVEYDTSAKDYPGQIQHRCVLTHTTLNLRPLRPVRPELHPLHPVRPELCPLRPVRPELRPCNGGTL